LDADQYLKDSVSNLLVEQNFNLVLDSGKSLVDFTFDGVNIASEKLGKQTIANIEVL
jgi:hypothetical protein